MAVPDKEETAQQKLARLENLVVKAEALGADIADVSKNCANPINEAYQALTKAITDEIDKQVLVDYWEQRAKRLKR